MQALKTLLIYFLFTASFVLCGVVYIFLLLVFGPAKSTWFRRIYGATIIRVSGCKLMVDNRPSINNGPYLFIPNHQSIFDVFMLAAAIPHHFSAIAKQELFSVPFFGYIIKKMGVVSIDRSDRYNARLGINQAAIALAAGTSMIIFPEGTRSKDGQIGIFKKGAFKLALDAQATIIPIGISGAYEAQPANTWLIFPGTLKIRFGQPINFCEYQSLSLSDLSNLVREQVIQLSSNP